MVNRYREGEHSLFTHQDKMYRVDDLIDAIENHAEHFVDIEPLTWLFSSQENYIDPRRAAKTDLFIPIIYTQLPTGQFVVLDGIHRLAKSIILGNRRIKAKYCPSFILDKLSSVNVSQ